MPTKVIPRYTAVYAKHKGSDKETVGIWDRETDNIAVFSISSFEGVQGLTAWFNEGTVDAEQYLWSSGKDFE